MRQMLPAVGLWSELLVDANFHKLGCIGPGLYDWKEDGQFAQWLIDYPTSHIELTTCYIEASLSKRMKDSYPNFATSYPDPCIH